ncbi:MAG: CDP-diacylglycerol--serine O-phosphatidyltransferase [Nanoarchaeota archaeon]|nr:CDP-diacylglycerol--serine O-phosphatidyltransferase [Nanoarchaeota archaeon]MBU1269600.1 CDP-diacylglycerol--serine O-phosphatidyltransferase [Nanoarchaeota archaeon]MBU1605058.1 CDP-diacylglycerol--serine O-phosphatidyltransferase [Nanoarchaeota archaeon]MBU2442612.1 CDP-diacylglycerol--serine O-phosphatidyltransferase [Nanoarchaeota archaeon]
MTLKKNISDIFTLLNLTSGFVSILFAVNDKFLMASVFIILSVVLDFFDGRVARYLGTESELGAQLDSLSDLVSFGVAPAVLMYLVFNNDILGLLLVIFVLCGAFRLARFNILRKKVKGFIGMPITINGVIFPVLYFANAGLVIVSIVVVASAALMVSTIHFNKVK